MEVEDGVEGREELGGSFGGGSEGGTGEGAEVVEGRVGEFGAGDWCWLRGGRGGGRRRGGGGGESAGDEGSGARGGSGDSQGELRQ